APAHRASAVAGPGRRAGPGLRLRPRGHRRGGRVAARPRPDGGRQRAGRGAGPGQPAAQRHRQRRSGGRRRLRRRGRPAVFAHRVQSPHPGGQAGGVRLGGGGPPPPAARRAAGDGGPHQPGRQELGAKNGGSFRQRVGIGQRERVPGPAGGADGIARPRGEYASAEAAGGGAPAPFGAGSRLSRCDVLRGRVFFVTIHRRHVLLVLFTALLLLGYGALARWLPWMSAPVADTRAGRIVAIDAGHGGPDPGAVGPSGVLEKDVTLAIALKLEEVLKQAGIETVMTRTGDYDLVRGEEVPHRQRADLIRRAELVNHSGAQLLLSLHANSFPDPAWSG